MSEAPCPLGSPCRTKPPLLPARSQPGGHRHTQLHPHHRPGPRTEECRAFPSSVTPPNTPVSVRAPSPCPAELHDQPLIPLFPSRRPPPQLPPPPALPPYLIKVSAAAREECGPAYCLPPAPAPRPAPAPVTRPRSQVPGRGKTSRAASPGASGAAPLPRADSCGLTVAVLSPSASSRRVPSGGGASRAGSVASGRPGWATGLGVVRGKIVISVIRHGGTAQRRVGSTRSSVRPGRRHGDGTGSLEDGDSLLLGAVTAASPAGMPGCCWRLGGHKGGVRDAQPLSRPAGWQLRCHSSRRSRKPVGHPRGRRPG